MKATCKQEDVLVLLMLGYSSVEVVDNLATRDITHVTTNVLDLVVNGYYPHRDLHVDHHDCHDQVADEMSNGTTVQ